jgi:hypothetical protein
LSERPAAVERELRDVDRARDERDRELDEREPAARDPLLRELDARELLAPLRLVPPVERLRLPPLRLDLEPPELVAMSSPPRR